MSDNTTASSNSSISLYLTGGCALNLGRQLKAPFTQYNAYFIDTSESNLRRPGIDRNNVFVFEGVDGSGKVRSENHTLISKSILKILQQFPAGKFNIIISSASGGTGAVIAHNLLAELKKRGEQVVILLIGSTASHDEIENTIKTLKSLDALAAKVQSPIVMHYLENSVQHPREEIDRAALGGILMLLALFSGQHEELDSADLKTWMNHKKLGNQAVSLQFAYNRQQYDAASDVLSVATLAGPGMNTLLEPPPAYQAVGYIPESWQAGDVLMSQDEPMHYLLSGELVQKVSSQLNAKLKDVGGKIASHVRRESLVSGDEESTDDGLIL